MSRIIANNIRHNDATADSLSFDSSGNVSVPNDLAVNTDTLFVDVSADQVGIGTSSPQASLHIGNGTGNGVEIGNNGTLQVIDRGNSRIEPLTVTAENVAFSIARNTSTTLHDERARITYDGLTFNGDTAAANALADYEEGTWTPTTYSNNLSVGSASYVKVGKMVTVHCYLTGVSSWTAATSNPFWIFSFPFAPDGGSGYSAVGSVTLHAISTSQSGTLSAVMDSTNGRCRIQNNPTNGSFDTITLAEMGATTWTCTVSITYRTTT